MDRKEIAVIISSLAGLLAITSKIVNGELQFDAGTIAALWGAAAPAIALIRKKAAPATTPKPPDAAPVAGNPQ